MDFTRTMGYAHEVIVQKYLPDIAELEIRSDDIFVVSYPKAGTTWTLHMVCQILGKERQITDKCIFEEIPYLEFPQGNSVREIDTTPGQYELIPSMASPRVIKTHLQVGNLPRDMKFKRPKVIYVARNPKDTAVSMYHFCSLIPDYKTFKEWSDFLHHFSEGTSPRGSWFDHVLQYWQRSKVDPNILFIKYEDMIKDLRGTVLAISEFLQRSLSDEHLDSILRNSTFDAMRTNPRTNPDNNPLFGEKTAKGKSLFLRKGKVGDWKTYFTVKQNEHFDSVYRDKLRDSNGLTFDFSST